MCVILVCPAGIRPDLETLQACAAANPHGAGVAWRGKREVRWSKNLSADETGLLLEQIEGEAIVHFRWASVGGVDPSLCHPFPVTRAASTALVGSANRVLFHNGTWRGYGDALSYVEREEGRKIGGPISDSRVMALLVNHLNDPTLLRNVDGRFAFMERKQTTLFGYWREWRGMQCSNLGFLYELERIKRPVRKTALSTSVDDQLALWEASIREESL